VEEAGFFAQMTQPACMLQRQFSAAVFTGRETGGGGEGVMEGPAPVVMLRRRRRRSHLHA